MGPQLPSPTRGQTPNFRPIFIVAKRLDASRCHLVGLSPGNFVLDGDPSSPPLKGQPPILSNVHGGQTTGWMKTHLVGNRPRPRPHCIRRVPALREMSTAAPPHLFGLCLLWPRSPISATAELLLPLIRHICLNKSVFMNGHGSQRCR